MSGYCRRPHVSIITPTLNRGAMLAIATGDLNRARAFLQRALQLEPADLEAIFARQMLFG